MVNDRTALTANRIDCCCMIPRHNSALSSSSLSEVLLRSIRFSEHDTANATGDADENKSSCFSTRSHVNYIHMLMLQCHSEGVFWRGLVPILVPSSSEYSNHGHTEVESNDCHHHSSLDNTASSSSSSSSPGGGGGGGGSSSVHVLGQSILVSMSYAPFGYVTVTHTFDILVGLYIVK